MSGGHGGYVRVYRSLLGHAAFRNDGEAMAFAWLIMRAAYRPMRVRYKDRTVHLERGQWAVSVRDMAQALDRDRSYVERLLKRLRAETMIETAVETGISVITICNYSSFQLGSEEAETPAEAPAETPAETGARQGRDTEKRRESNLKEIKPARGAARNDARAPARVGAVVEPQTSTDWLDRAGMFRAMGREHDAIAAERRAHEARETERQAADSTPPQPTFRLISPEPSSATPTQRRPREASPRPQSGPAGVVAIGMQVAEELELDQRRAAAGAAG